MSAICNFLVKVLYRWTAGLNRSPSRTALVSGKHAYKNLRTWLVGPNLRISSVRVTSAITFEPSTNSKCTAGLRPMSGCRLKRCVFARAMALTDSRFLARGNVFRLVRASARIRLCGPKDKLNVALRIFVYGFCRSSASSGMRNVPVYSSSTACRNAVQRNGSVLIAVLRHYQKEPSQSRD